MAAQDPKDLIKGVQDAFIESVLRNLKLELVRKVITVPRLKDNPGFPVYDEYADWRNLSDAANSENIIAAANELGSGVAILYNALIQNAERILKHKVVTDLFANDNLKFVVVVNDQPSVADPAALIRGWVSFRFHFKSSNERPESLSTNQTTLSKIEARPRY